MGDSLGGLAAFAHSIASFSTPESLFYVFASSLVGVPVGGGNVGGTVRAPATSDAIVAAIRKMKKCPMPTTCSAVQPSTSDLRPVRCFHTSGRLASPVRM